MVEQRVSHYGAEYFASYEEGGRFAGWANLPKFSSHIRADMKVVDFGCGAADLLARVRCREKLGIEINPIAREAANQNNHIRTVARTDDVPDDWADIIISNHALEHSPDPLCELRLLLTKVAPGGKVVFVVPCESVRMGYAPGNIDRHLYSWGPRSMGNLFHEAGFEVLESKAVVNCWPPRFLPKLMRSIGGRPLFAFGCTCWGILAYFNLVQSGGQVRVIAVRPSFEGR